MKLMSDRKLDEWYKISKKRRRTMSIWITSDTHLGHTNILRYCKRPFKDVDEMDRVIIDNWNSRVKKGDTVYHLGDFSFRNPGEYLKELNGEVILVLGNHDYKRRKVISKCFREVYDLKTIKIAKHDVTLSHYAMRVWPKSHFNEWHLFGHSHGGLEGQGKSFDVGVDTHDFYPWSVDEIKEEMDKRPDNFNWVKRLPGYCKKEYLNELQKRNYD